MTHLKIEQNTSSIEVVDAKVITKLYDLTYGTVGDNLDNTSNLKGNLQCSHAYEDVVSYLTTKYPNLLISITGGMYIRFNDKTVESICATNWGDGIGITTVLAASVATIGFLFNANNLITSFNELLKFVNITYIDGYSNNDEKGAFRDCTALTSIKLPNSIKTIRANAFRGCSNLNNIDLSNITNIDNNAFLDCSNLTNITSLLNLITIGGLSFTHTKINIELNLPNLTGKFNGFAYSGIPKVTNLGYITDMAESDSYHEYDACLAQCLNLTQVTLPDTLLSIGGISNCPNLTSCMFNSNVTTIKLYTFLNDTSLTTIGDLSNVNSIGFGAFINCKLSSLNFSNKLTTIYGNAFYGCSALTTVGDLSNVATITGDSIFKNCNKLSSLNFSNKLTVLPSNMFYGCSALTTIGDTSNVTIFSLSCCELCNLLASIQFNSVVSIKDRSFYGNALTSVILPNTISDILADAFHDCNLLSSITFDPNGSTLLYLGKQMIANCPLLNYIILPANTYSIALGFLNSHNNASTIVLNSSTPPTLGGAIGGSSSTLFYVPDNSVSAYKAATNWSDLSSRIKAMCDYPISTTISAYQFKNWTGYFWLEMSNVTNIGDHAFANTGLSTGPLGKTYGNSTDALTVQYYAFLNCTNLQHVSFMHLTDLGAHVFDGCDGLRSVKLGDYCTSIGPECFNGCTSLDYITCGNATPPVMDGTMLDGAKNTCNIYVPDSYVATYKAHSGWSNYASRIYSYTQLNTDYPGTR